VANLVITESAHTQLDVSYWFTTHHKDYKINFGFEAERWHFHTNFRYDCLKDDGIFLLHTLGWAKRGEWNHNAFDAWLTFIVWYNGVYIV
jgi:hypothetical protein